MVGIDSEAPVIERANKRLCGIPNVVVQNIGFEEFEAVPESFDLITFVASMHHMNHEFCVEKAEKLLKPGGILLIVGLAKTNSISDWIVDIARVIPARIGSAYHGEMRDGIGVPTKEAEADIKTISMLARRIFSNVKIRRGLYYRYLLSCEKVK